MSYFDSPVEITTPVTPRQRQTNYKMKKKKKVSIVKSTPLNNSNNKNATSVDSIQTMVDGAVQLSSDGLSDDKVDMSKLSLTTSSLPVSSKASAKSDVSMVRITRHVEHSNISKRVSNSSTSDTIRSDITNSDTNDDDVTNNNPVTNNTSTGISVKSVNYDSAEINDVPHSQKKIGQCSPNSQSSRKSKLVVRWYYK